MPKEKAGDSASAPPPTSIWEALGEAGSGAQLLLLYGSGAMLLLYGCRGTSASPLLLPPLREEEGICPKMVAESAAHATAGEPLVLPEVWGEGEGAWREGGEPLALPEAWGEGEGGWREGGG